MIQSPPIRVIVIEDDPDWQELITDMLYQFDLHVDTFSSLKEAMPALFENGYAIAISDLSLSQSDPGNKDGFDLLSLIQRLNSPCATILLTGYGSIDVAVEAITRYRVFAFLTKEGLDRSEFTNTIQRILTRHAAP